LQDRIRIRSVEVLSDEWAVLKKTVFDYQRSDGTWEMQIRQTYDRGDGAVILVDTDKLTSYFRHISQSSMGLDIADINNDGLQDILFTGNMVPARLYLNKGNLKFEDITEKAGVEGMGRWARGVSIIDINNDGLMDLYICNTIYKDSLRRRNILYVNQGIDKEGIPHFKDMAAEYGLDIHVQSTMASFFDYDNDGRPDLFVANGAVYVIAALRGEAYPYHEKNQLFHNEGNSHFAETSQLGGPAFQQSEVSRGAAFGDVDNDGDIDIVLSNNNGPTRLLLNQMDSSHYWLKVRLEGTQSNREGVGARVGLFTKGHRPQWRYAHRDGSYLSASDVAVHFGLGQNPIIDALVVEWPSKRNEVWNGIKANKSIDLREGSGKPYRAQNTLDALGGQG
jgi:hypothetical protein